MKDIIQPIPAALIEKELTPERRLRKTNFGGNEIYSVTAHNAPNAMLELGRLRELSFRAAGGGTGKEADIDDYDTCENPYHQLIVWDPENRLILGGYRYLLSKEAGRDEHGIYKLATTHLFNFSDDFNANYAPDMLELGRSFVQPAYQSSQAGRRSMFALDNLWDGLGAVVVENPQIRYLFGKVTMYLDYNQLARDYILYFMQLHFGDKQQLVYPKEPLSLHHPEAELAKIFTGSTYQENYRILSKQVRALGENIPPLINSYMNLSPTMKTFGTVLNAGFGNVEETGILITLGDVYPEKAERHIVSYLTEKAQRAQG